MQFDEAIELFGEETLESMAMAYIVGGATHNGCTQSGTCMWDTETYNGCTQKENCRPGSTGDNGSSGTETGTEGGGTEGGGTVTGDGNNGNNNTGNSVQIGIIVGCR